MIEHPEKEGGEKVSTDDAGPHKGLHHIDELEEVGGDVFLFPHDADTHLKMEDVID